MKKIFTALASIRLAVILLAYLAVTGIAASLVPQGLAAKYYAGRYPPALAKLIGLTGFSDFFRSPLFLAPAALFFLNLGACTVGRLARERRKSRRRHGPDILHVGLMLLIAASALSFWGRQSGLVRLAKGDSASLPGGRILDLTDFAYLAYADGRPRDWISTVRISKGPEVQMDGYPIRVNHPLRLGLLSIYQASSESELVLALRDSSGLEHDLARGEETDSGGARLLLVDASRSGGPAKVRIRDSSGSRTVDLVPGDSVDGLGVIGTREVLLSGLEAVYDPGYPLVLLSLALAAFGIFLTFIQKLRDMGASAE